MKSFVIRSAMGLALACGFCCTDMEKLARIIPLVGGGCDVEALVALQADERTVER